MCELECLGNKQLNEQGTFYGGTVDKRGPSLLMLSELVK
jgi:hypothetical protein